MNNPVAAQISMVPRNSSKADPEVKMQCDPRHHDLEWTMEHPNPKTHSGSPVLTRDPTGLVSRGALSCLFRLLLSREQEIIKKKGKSRARLS